MARHIGLWSLGGLVAAIAGPLALGLLALLQSDSANISKTGRWFAEASLAASLLIATTIAARLLSVSARTAVVCAVVLFPLTALLEAGTLYVLVNVLTRGSSE